MRIVPYLGPRPDEFRLLRGRLAFTGAAGLGATGTFTVATATGQVELGGLFVWCTEDLQDTVDGAVFSLGVTGSPLAFWNSSDTPVDLDNINAGVGLTNFSAVETGNAHNLVPAFTGGVPHTKLIGADIIGTVSTQAITDGQLDFFVWWRPLSSNGNLALGANLTVI